MSIQLSTRVMHIKDESTGSYDTVDVLKSSGVDDVQIDGTSVVSQGVANVPIAGINQYGVVRTDATLGSAMSNGVVYPVGANSNRIKEAAQQFQPIMPYRQHESTFYGLAKASGDSTQSASTNSVGTYTDEAKVAIQNMLGLNQQGELIADVTATEDLTAFDITTDLNGQPFELLKMIILFSAGPSTTGSRDSFYCQAYYKSDTNISSNFSTPSLTYPTATSNMLSKQEIIANPGMPVSVYSIAATGDGNSQNVNSMSKASIAKVLTGFKIYQSGTGKTLIPSGANLKIYGIRV